MSRSIATHIGVKFAPLAPLQANAGEELPFDQKRTQLLHNKKASRDGFVSFSEMD